MENRITAARWPCSMVTRRRRVRTSATRSAGVTRCSCRREPSGCSRGVHCISSGRTGVNEQLGTWLKVCMSAPEHREVFNRIGLSRRLNLILEADSSGGWHSVAFGANWLTWAVFALDFAVILIWARSGGSGFKRCLRVGTRVHRPSQRGENDAGHTGFTPSPSRRPPNVRRWPSCGEQRSLPRKRRALCGPCVASIRLRSFRKASASSCGSV